MDIGDKKTTPDVHAQSFPLQPVYEALLTGAGTSYDREWRDNTNTVIGTESMSSVGEYSLDVDKYGIFGATPAVQQTGGAATAAGAYGATEQTMLQKVYDALRTFGFLS